MRYMMLIYTTEIAEAAASPEQRQELIDRHRAVMEETARRGILRGAEPLAPTGTATTVRSDSGKVVLMDGPFAETKEQWAATTSWIAGTLTKPWNGRRRSRPHTGEARAAFEIRPIRRLGERWDKPRTART